MREKVFKDSSVKSEIKDTVNVELEFVWSDPYKQRYGVTNSQVCVMCDSEGHKIGNAIYVNPVPTPEKFVEWLRTVKPGAKSVLPAPPAKKK